jgi:hypothetical protein
MQAWTERIALRHLAPVPQVARLREPHGHDELALAGVDTCAAVHLLDRLLDAPGASAAALSASDRDGVLAALHRGLWGDRIVSSLACGACGALYDLSFELSALQRQLLQSAEAAQVRAPRELRDAHDVQWRLPAVEEEDSAAQSGIQAGRAQLAGQACAAPDGDPQWVAERLEALAPLLDVDLDTRCAECGHAQQARFDIQSFVLQRLLDEREAVLGEVHALAGGYGWSLQEILSLPRSLRRSLVQRLAAAPSPAFG